MDVRKLRHFCAVVEKGNFARASESCHVSQPAISASIVQLEIELGMKLLDRGAFGARPTSLGLELYSRAKTILADLRRTSEEMAALRDGIGGRVTVGIGPLFEHTVMPSVIARFAAARPGVSVSTSVGVTEVLLDRLAAGELDFTISSPTGWLQVPAGIEIELLEETSDIVVAAIDHPVFNGDDLSLQALIRHPWIVSAGVSEAARNFFEALASQNLPVPEIIVRTDSIPILRALVLEQGFLAVVSPHFVRLLFHQGRDDVLFRTIPCTAFAIPRRMCIGTRSGRQLSKAATEMLSLVREVCEASLLA